MLIALEIAQTFHFFIFFYRCFPEQETLPLLLSIGLSQEQTQAQCYNL